MRGWTVEQVKAALRDFGRPVSLTVERVVEAPKTPKASATTSGATASPQGREKLLNQLAEAERKMVEANEQRSRADEELMRLRAQMK